MRLEDVRSSSFSALSGGQRQRVLIARALAGNPEILLLDEPTANVDASVGSYLSEILLELNRELTIMLVTHDMGFVHSLTGRVFCINKDFHEHPLECIEGGASIAEHQKGMKLVRHDIKLENSRCGDVLMIDNFISAVFNPSVPFIRYAFLAGLFSSIAFGMIGTYVVVKRISYIAGSVSHATLAGIGFAVYMNEVHSVTWLTPMTGGLISALITAVILSFVTSSSRERSDTAIGTVWALGMAVGILFIYASPGYGDPMSYLFGNILLIKKADLFYDSCIRHCDSSCCYALL